MKKRGIFIAVPTIDNKLTTGLSRLAVEAAALAFSPDCPFAFSWFPLPGIRPIEFARNLCVRYFLESDCEWLWFLDADIEPPGDWVKILEHCDGITADLVAGPVLGYDLVPETGLRLKMLAYVRTDTPGNLKSSATLVGKEADAAGTGCLLIHRRVFEDPKMLLSPLYVDKWGRERSIETDDCGEHDQYRAPAFFHQRYRPNGRVLDGEDIDFCIRARELGYVLRVHEGNIWSQVEDLPLANVYLACDYAARTSRC